MTAAAAVESGWVADELDDADVLALLSYITPVNEPLTDQTDARERLRRLLAERAATGGPALYPLSWNQTSLWYMHQLAPTSAAYHVGGAFRWAGEADVEALARALQALSDRHSALRTRFVTVQGRPFQEVYPRLATPLEVVDCTGLDEAALVQRVQSDYEAPLELEHGPALKARIYVRPGEQSVVLLVIHHALMDLWSLAVVYSDLGDLYAAERDATAVELPLVTQYPEFVRWQRELLRSDTAPAQVRYWEQRLVGMPPLLDLPADRPRPPMHSQRGRAIRFALDREATTGLVRLAREEGTTTFVVLLAAFQTLMHRYSGQDDLGVGTPMGGRGGPGFRELVGHCVNMAVMRAHFGGHTSFRELLAETKRALAEAIEREDFPFSQLVGRLGVQQDPSRSPLFQVCFIFQQSPLIDLNSLAFGLDLGHPIEVGGLQLEPFPLWAQQGQFDLSLWTARIAGRLHGELKYRDDLFDASTAERMARHYELLLRGIVADPNAPVDRLPLLDEADRALVVDEWNRTEREYRRDMCLHQLVEEQAERTPDAVAVESADRSLTYRELERRANRLAHELRSLRVERGSLVGVFVDRTPDTIVALLAILKAGGGYVPLETHYPPARIQFIVESLGIRVAVSESGRAEQLSAVAALLAHVVRVDDEAARAGRPETRVPDGPTAETTAYIIFTSGSTGTPKGVEVQHRPVINLIEWVNRTYGVGPGDRLLFITSLSFDLSVYDIFGVLAAGATIRIAAREEIQDPRRLTALLVEDGITIWDSAPPALNQLVPFLPAAAPQSPLRLVLLSGDWIPVKLPDQIRRVFERAHVVSLGGATEATIWSNYFDIGAVDPDWVSIPYGRPIQNARYYVLDPLRNSCPIGVPGDLFIGGEVLAVGYVNDPEKTAAKFPVDPFSAAPGARMYDTGDRARFFPDGNLEFLGRRDFQVKIRGYRIELGEIDAVLSEHPGVAECTVIARADGGGERYLAAYVVPRDGSAPVPGDLRAHLKERLPEFMVPQHFVTLDRLPLTANGKVDWRSLPVPERRREDLGSEYVAPTTETERRLAEIWEQVLRVDRVGTTDNFFDLGGHSLLAVRVVFEFEAQTGVALPVSALLQGPTIGALAQRLKAGADANGKASLLVVLREGALRPPLFLLHPSGGEVIAYRALVSELDPGRPLMGVQSASRVGAADPTSVEAMARLYVDAIRAAQPRGPYCLAGWSLGGVLAQAVAAQLERAGETVALCALLDSVLPGEHPKLLQRIAYRIGAAFGPLAGALASEDDATLAALLELPEPARIQRAIQIARARGAAVAELPRVALEREIAVAAAHSTALAEHRPAMVNAPLRVIWAEATTGGARRATDWSRFTRGGVEELVLEGAHHYSVLMPPHVSTVCMQLGQWLAAATAALGAPG